MTEQSLPASGDKQTSVFELREVVRQFVEERNWRQFHSPKNLSMSLAIEAAELMEHFQWLTVDESRKLADDDDRRPAIAEELADVISYALALANEMNIDVTTTLREKMKKNAVKYPAEKYFGRFGPDDPGR